MMRDEQPATPVSSREPLPAKDFRATDSTPGSARPSPAGKENEAIRRNPSRNTGAPEPPVKTEAPESLGSSATTAPGNSVASQPAHIWWDGPTIARAGLPFTVVLRLTSEQQVRVVPMQLRFDPEILALVSVRAGDYFGAGGSANFGYHVNRAGSIRVGASAQAPASAVDAALIVVTFKPIKAGTLAELRISALDLEGSAGPIAYDNIMPFIATITP
jgi:hypothetical protein